MTIVCTGSIAYDYLMTFPGYFRDHILPERIESLSLSFLVDSMVRQKGGTAPNIAYTLALLGEHPIVMGTVGEDFEDYRAWLNSNGINTDYIKVIPGEYTASFFANTDLAHIQLSSFYTGAMAHAKELSIRSLSAVDVDLVVISPNDPLAMQLYAEECSQLSIPYLYDIGQQVVRIDPEKLRQGVEGAYSLFLNDYEFQLLQKHTGLKLEDILSKVNLLVITFGEQGSTIYTGGDIFQIKVIPPVKIVDPTGVGDAFRGGFLRGYDLGLDWQTCGQMGALAATYCLEQSGTLNHNYTRSEFVDRYRKYFDDGGVLDVLLEN
ncbi:MAG TPA: carbohydrate kinase family protein [Anaerolineaceae bacterium]|nr:carbohydrate kinase family protein [Anaerolineaceae bacterium]